ncbi:MAG: DUF3857 domain-containing protein, partial [bacterium]|nr:DUF3857 domain-containing protein [bacterium]
PEQLWQLAEKIQDSTTPAVAVVEHTEIRFLPGNSTEERVQRAILINVAEQANEQLVHRVAYVPEVQRLRVLSARILRRDGSEVNARRAETPRLSDPALNMFYDTRLRIFQFRELEDGDLIEMSYVLSETAEANDTGPYKGGLIRLAGDLPIHLLEVSLEGRQEYLPDWEVVHLNGMPEMSERDDGSRHIGWTWGNVAALPREVPRPPELLVAPYLVYSNHPEWPDLADWYGRHIQPRIRISSQIEELANKLVKGIQNRRERISRIYRYVANDIQYVGLELGEHRFRPFSASWVLSHQIGDCKDKAALMVALFKVVGIPAQMVLVRTADLGEVPSELAVLEVFNHVIAYLPEDDLWLDGTASGQDPFFPPGLDQVAWSLVIGQKGARPGPTPVIGAGLSKVFCRLERDDTSSEVLVEMRTEDTGDAASSRRAQLFGSRNPQKFATWLQGIFPGAEVLGEAELSMPPSQDPARFSIRGKMPLSVLTGSGGVQAYPGRINLVSNLAPVGERTTPVLMTVRPVLNWTVEVMLGESGETLPDDIALDTRFGSFELRYEEVTKGYTVEGSLVLKSGLVEPDAVPDLRRFLLEVEEALGRPVEVR